MCFTIHQDYPNPQIAEEDIPCVKEGTFYYPCHFISLFHGYVYKLKELQPRVNLRPVDGYIREGYHSWSLRHPTLYYPCLEERTRVKCIIPKGSTFYYNPVYREYVSDQIMVVEKII